MPSKQEYTVGWVAALHGELAAARLMLDETHPAQPQPARDPNTYILGRILSHNVVIACLPAGNYGTNEAAAVVSHMRATFPNLEYFLMVGIGGGVPSAAHDIRLGDVVVSKPTGRYGGVIQYDFGKAVAGEGFHQKGMLNQPPQCLLTRITYLQADHMGSNIHSLKAVLEERLGIAEVAQRDTFMRPHPATDILFAAKYCHHEPTDSSCAQCDNEQLVNRRPRSSDEPQVHYGLIGSANQVMRDGMLRDNLAQNYGDILCFEMEAAGLMNQAPCLVIRGICDYADLHKNKHWQNYAAFTAAGYARLLLSVVTSADTQERAADAKPMFDPEQSECLKSLFVTDSADDRNVLKRTKGARVPGTAEWILDTADVEHWLSPEGANILWLHGNPGTGKTTIAITLTEELCKLKTFANGNSDFAYFFCDSSTTERRTATGILRGLLHQLISNRPELMPYLMKRYKIRGDGLFESFDALWQIILDISRHNRRQYFIVDALDECDMESQKVLLAQINLTFSSSMSSASKPAFLIISRPYPEIRERLEHFDNRDLSSYRRLRTDLDVYIENRVADLTRKKRYTKNIAESVSTILRKKAEGTFLWVSLACSGLESYKAKDAVRMLQGYPQGLHHLYQQMLDSALQASDSNEGMIIKVLESVAIARRPLRISDLAEACESYQDEVEEDRLAFLEDNVHECRLLVVLQSSYVRLLHKSVKDFLLSEGEGCKINPPTAHASLARTCIVHILNHQASLGDQKADEIRGTFLEYAVLYWPEHAFLARQQFQVTRELKQMFQTVSTGLKNWLALYNQVKKYSKLPEGFSVLHVAARWGIVPLLEFAMNDMQSRLQVRSFAFEDEQFATKDGVSPIEEAANAGQVKILKGLLAVNSSISHNSILAAVSNEKSGDILLAAIVETLPGYLEVTTDLIVAAAQNRDKGKEIITFLLDRYAQNVFVTEGVLIAAAQNQGSGKDVMELFLERGCEGFEITEELAVAAAGNWTQGREIMRLLLEAGRESEVCTADVLEAAARNRVCGKELVELFLQQEGKALNVTEEVWIAAAGNEGAGKEIISLLLQAGHDNYEITEDLVEAAASEDMMMMFLSPQQSGFSATADALALAAERFPPKVVDSMQAHQRLGHKLTEEACGMDLGPPIDADPTPASNPTLVAHESPHTIEECLWIHILRRHVGAVRNLVMAPKTNLLASTSSDLQVHLWDSEAGGLHQTVECWSESSRVTAISPDLRFIASARGDGLIFIHYFGSDGPGLGMQRSIGGLREPIHALDISYDGETIAAAYGNRALLIWDFEASTPKRSSISHTDTVMGVAFSSNEPMLASGSRDGQVKVWSAASGKTGISGFHDHNPRAVTAVGFSPDDQLLVVGKEDGSVVVWNRQTSDIVHLLKGHYGSITDLRFSPDMVLLASASSDTTVKVWDITAGLVQCTLEGHIDRVTKVRFSPDGEHLASGSLDKTIRIWSPPRGFPLSREIKVYEPVYDLVFTEDESLRVATDVAVRTWDMASFQRGDTHILRYFEYSLCFSPDSRVLATSSYSNVVRLWSCENGRLLHTLNSQRDRNTALAFAPDGDTLASGSVDASLIVWDAVKGEKRVELPGHNAEIVKIRFSQDGIILASASSDGYLWLWETSSWTLLRVIHLQGFHSNPPYTLGFTPDHHTIRVHGVHSNPPHTLDFTPDCKVVAFALRNDGWGVWQSSTDTIEIYRASSNVRSIWITPDATLVATLGCDLTVDLWQIATGTLLGRHSEITNIALSPDGRLLALSSIQGPVELWKVETRTPFRVLRGANSTILSLAFSADGALLAAGTSSGHIFVWRADS